MRNKSKKEKKVINLEDDKNAYLDDIEVDEDLDLNIDLDLQKELKQMEFSIKSKSTNLISEFELVNDSVFFCVIGTCLYLAEYGNYKLLYTAEHNISNLRLKNNNLYFLENNTIKRLDLNILTVEVLLYGS